MERTASWVFSAFKLELLLVVEQAGYRHEPATGVAENKPLPLQQEPFSEGLAV